MTKGRRDMYKIVFARRQTKMLAKRFTSMLAERATKSYKNRLTKQPNEKGSQKG